MPLGEAAASKREAGVCADVLELEAVTNRIAVAKDLMPGGDQIAAWILGITLRILSTAVLAGTEDESDNDGRAGCDGSELRNVVCHDYLRGGDGVSDTARQPAERL